MSNPPIEVDWTADPETNRSNSSPEFEQLASAVEQLILNSSHSLLHGRTEIVARLIMAQLAHVHELAPRKVSVQSADTNPEGIIRGIFLWNDTLYKYEAKPQE